MKSLNRRACRMQLCCNHVSRVCAQFSTSSPRAVQQTSQEQQLASLDALVRKLTHEQTVERQSRMQTITLLKKQVTKMSTRRSKYSSVVYSTNKNSFRYNQVQAMPTINERQSRFIVLARLNNNVSSNSVCASKRQHIVLNLCACVPTPRQLLLQLQ
jgi:hypothetical protein